MKCAFRISLLLTTLAAVVCEAQISRFEHIIVVVQENRTPDNLFHALCDNNPCSTNPDNTQYDIQIKGWLNGSGTTDPTPAKINNGYDLNHSHPGWLAECNLPPTGCNQTNHLPTSCAMNGASCTSPAGHPNGAYIYVDNSTGTIAPYITLATSYGWANYMFQTNQGPSFPAHQFLFGGSSALSYTDDAAHRFLAGNYAAGKPVGNPTAAGCVAQDGENLPIVDGTGKMSTYTINHSTNTVTCIPLQSNGGRNTMADLLESVGMDWRYYSTTYGMPGSTYADGDIWTAPNALLDICMPDANNHYACAGSRWNKHVVLTPATVLSDMANCNLAPVSWVIPKGGNSDHPGGSTGGPAWVASIYNQLDPTKFTCGYWNNTAIVVTWDDFGGFYDHEPPPITDSYELGFRVPLLFISAYTQAQYIDNTKYHDFGSILRFIENNFSLPGGEGALGFADKRAKTDLSTFYNLSNPARKFVGVAAPRTAEDFINDKTPSGPVDDD